MFRVCGKCHLLFCERRYRDDFVCVVLSQSPVEAREDKATIKCETSPPSSPRGLRLDQMNFAQLTGSLEDGRG